MTLSDRKRDHLRVCLEEDVRSSITNGLERFRLEHQALPEMALDDVSLRTTFLARELATPLMVSSMTGGTVEAREINRRLARVAEDFGLSFALGSVRAAIERPDLWETYQVRDVAPHVFLLANLGAVQLNGGVSISQVDDAVQCLGADALILHLNPLQEALQKGGDTGYRNLAERIAALCAHLTVPVIVKEVGNGLSVSVARRLWEAGVSALDVAGAGGTSWSEVERQRTTDPDIAEIASAFADWGIPTAQSLTALHAIWPDRPLIASGGIANGVDIVKCLCLGASLVGMAHALLGAAASSEADLARRVGVILRQLRIAMFCVGARTPRDLDGSRLVRVPA